MQRPDHTNELNSKGDLFHMATFKRRARAVFAGSAILTASLGGSIAFGAITAGVASASLPTNVTYNDNGCTTAAAAGSVSGIAIGLGSAQTDPALANSVDAATGLVNVGAGNAKVVDSQAYTASSTVLQGAASTLTDVGGHGFVPAAFLQAGVGLGFISVGSVIPADATFTISADNATFTSTGTSTISVTGSGVGTVVGTGSTVTAPLDAAIQLADIDFTVPNTPGVNAVFYQKAFPIAGLPGEGSGTVNDQTTRLIANISPVLVVPLACMPGTGAATAPLYTATAQDDVLVFAALEIAPALPPTLVPQTIASVNLGGPAIVHALAGATGNVPVIATSVVVTSPPSHGTAVPQPNGDVIYTNDGTGAGGGDSFQVTADSIGGTSAPVTETITSIVANPPSCNVSTQPGCALKQIVLVPVAAGDLVMSQYTGLPVDVLNHTLSGLNCTGPAVTLNGQPQFACGAMAPITVVNARGTDAGWTLSGQVSDFLDPAADPALTCDTPATANNHCIPGGNLSWQPAAGVAHGLVAGDTAEVTAGAMVLAL